MSQVERKHLHAGEQDWRLLVLYTGELKFPVSSVLWLVVIKLPCGVHQSYCPYVPKVSRIIPAPSWDVKMTIQWPPWKPAELNAKTTLFAGYCV